MSCSLEENPNNFNFESLFRTLNRALRANLSHPQIRKDFRWLCKFSVLYTIFSSFFCLLIYNIISHDTKNGDITKACSDGSLCALYMVVTFDYCILFSYQNELRKLIDGMNIDYQLAKSMPKDERDVVIHFVRKSQSVAKFYRIFSIISGLLFVVKQVCLTIYYTVTDKFRLVHFYEVTYPDPVEQVKDDLIVYTILYVYISFFDIIATLMFLAFSPMGPIFLLHACGQMELAQKKILKIFHEKKSSSEINKEIKQVASFINRTYRFIDDIGASFKVLYELTLKSTTIAVPIILYLIISSFKNGEVTAEFVTFFIGAIVMSSIPCYYSDMLKESGGKLRLTVYTCGWETHWDSKSRKMILLLLLRTSRPVGLRTMFREVSLDALTDVYHQAYAIFNLLNAAWS